MKLLTEYSSAVDAENEAEKMENRGVLVHVSLKGPRDMAMFSGGSDKVGLWIVFDHQWQDANMYLRNRRHVVKTSFSAKELSDLQKKMGSEGRDLLLRWVVSILIIIVMIVGLTIYLLVER